MKSTRGGLVIPILLVAAASGATPARAEEGAPFDAAEAAVGASTFKTYCASCHGREGHGDGPIAESLKFRPADLTLIAKRNGWKFPFDKTARLIDGRDPLKGHGGTDMPVWGDAFKNARDGFSEAAVKAKVDGLVHFLASVQQPRR